MKTNKLGKIINYIFVIDNKEFSLENRLLISSLIAGIVISLLGSVVSLVISSSTTVIITAFALCLALLLTYYFVRIKGKFNILVFPIIVVSIIGISLIWIFDGGINGSNLFPGFVILVLALIIVPTHRKKFVILFFIASVIIIYLIQFYRPDLIVAFPSFKVRWIDSIITVIYSSILVFWIINFLHKNYTYERERAEKNAEELRKLNSTKDKLFSIIAHDLRSPFNSIIGFSELLIGNEKKSHEAQSKKYASLINSTATNTLVLLDNLLNWAKSQTNQLNYNPRKTNLSSIIREVIISSNSLTYLKNITLKIVQNEEVEVYADQNMVMIVLRNLISNAVKYTNHGGEINVIIIPGTTQVEISVSDNGVGMDEEKIKTLFNISSNTTSPGTANEKGSGLGLVLCKEFVEKLGGNIWVESEKGKGSNFKFTLPLKE